MRLTDEQRVAIFRMRLNGYTYKQIASEIGVSFQAAQQAMQLPKKSSYRSCVYPAIAYWMQDTQCGYVDIAAKTGLSINRIYNALTGSTDPSKKVIDAVCRLTHMTYEEAFCSENIDDDYAVS